MSDKISTPIVDKNGKATTVWRRVQPALTPGQRLSAVAQGFAKTKGQPPLDDWMKKDLFYTVQRLRPQQNGFFNDKTGIDSEFQLEYMGASEYEWGAPKDSLDRMRKDDLGLERLSQEFTYNGVSKTVHFVGTNLENKAAEFQQWLDDGAQSRDSTYFGENFDDTATEHRAKTQAWWSLSGDIAWTFDDDLAERLVTGIAPY